MESLKLKPPLRYLGHLKQSDTASETFELHESDVFWSPEESEPDPVSSPRTPKSPTIISGNRSLVWQRPAINPALSAVSGAREIHIPYQSPPSRTGTAAPSRMSAPVNVPSWPAWMEEEREAGATADDEGERAGEKTVVPPHEIVAQSHLSTTAFSVFEGAGRTLKGRDLRRVRNAVFRKTGFLD